MRFRLPSHVLGLMKPSSLADFLSGAAFIKGAGIPARNNQGGEVQEAPNNPPPRSSFTHPPPPPPPPPPCCCSPASRLPLNTAREGQQSWPMRRGPPSLPLVRGGSEHNKRPHVITRGAEFGHPSQ